VRVFVSGATGFIGIQLVRRLAGMGIEVHALYRSTSKAKLIKMEGVKLYQGDILDVESLLRGMKGCEQAYHVAAFAGVWSRDTGLIERLNVDGTMNVIHAAASSGISRVVVTSTAGILGPSESGPVNEESPPPPSFFSPYESSKFKMEQILKNRDEQKPEVIVVNPTRVYGPGYLSESNGVTKMIKHYTEGKWKFVPGNGESVGNYVFIEDVVTGHILAMKKGKHGERYVLGGENISYNKLFEYIRSSSGVNKKLIKLPLWVMLLVALFMKMFSLISGRPPMVVPNLVRKFNHQWIVSSEKAIQLLGYNPMGTQAGIEKTVTWLRSN